MLLLALLAPLACTPSTAPTTEPAAAAPLRMPDVGVQVAVGDVRPGRATVQLTGLPGGTVELALWGPDEAPEAAAAPTWPGAVQVALDPVSGTAVRTVEWPAGEARSVVARLVAEPGVRLRPTTQVRFPLPPPADEGRAVTLALVGDLGGQGWCRRVEGGYAILDAVRAAAPDVVLINGDQIYADGTCGAADPAGVATVPGGFASVAEVDWTDAAALRRAFDGHWAYNREDAAFRRLLGGTSVLVQWDDHEVVNDFGAGWDRWWTGDPARPGYSTLVREGRASFRRYNPIEAQAGDPDRIYRSFRWGRHVEIFLADARSYRSPNPEPDGPDKVLLGAEQLRWLVDGIRASDATWKLVSVDVPLAQPTGSAPKQHGRDAWASGVAEPDGALGTTGYEREQRELLGALDAADVANVVFLATDVHYARTARYRVDADRDGTPWETAEVISGPLSAWMGRPDPSDPDLPAEVLYAEGELPNFATVSVAADGSTLTVRTLGADGVLRPGSEHVFPARRAP